MGLILLLRPDCTGSLYAKAMKSAIFSFVCILSFVVVSCGKEQVPAPNSPATPVTVEYRVAAESGHFTIEYLVAENGRMVAKTETIDRPSSVIEFEITTGHLLSVKAYNTTPSGKEVHAEIYVNDVQFKAASANAPNAIAEAEGIY